MKKVEQHRKEHSNFSNEKNEQFKYGQKPIVIDAFKELEEEKIKKRREKRSEKDVNWLNKTRW